MTRKKITYEERIIRKALNEMSLHDSIRLMMTKLGVTKKQHGAIMEWEQFEGVMERRPETKKNAEMTFSIDAIAGNTAMFHLWLLGRVKDRWESQVFNPEKATRTVTIKAQVDWSEDI